MTECNFPRKRLLAILLLAAGLPVPALAGDVSGQFLLEGQTVHAAVTVTLSGSPSVPAAGMAGLALLATVIGVLLIRSGRRGAGGVALAVALASGAGLAAAAAARTAYTDAQGRFSFSGVDSGVYLLEAQKPCFFTWQRDPLFVPPEGLVLPPEQMSSHAAENQRRTAVNLELVACAETDYNNHSSPHTYTGTMACLVSGNGAGGVGFLPEDFADSQADGYRYLMGCSAPVAGSCWTWSAAAFPLTYGCTGRMSYYKGADYCSGRHLSADMGGAPGGPDMPMVCSGDRQEDLANITMRMIAAGQTDYNNNSNPHTYTGDIACLCSGHGAGNVRFICPDLADSESCGYTYRLQGGESVQGSIWTWSTAAWPVSYAPGTIYSYYIDESGIIRRADLGGAAGTRDMPPLIPIRQFHGARKPVRFLDLVFKRF